MQTILYTLLTGAMALSSCSKDVTDAFASQTETTTFSLAVDGAEARSLDIVNPLRYITKVWSADGTTAEKLFDFDMTNHAKLTSGSEFTVTLDKTNALFSKVDVVKDINSIVVVTLKCVVVKLTLTKTQP